MAVLSTHNLIQSGRTILINSCIQQNNQEVNIKTVYREFEEQSTHQPLFRVNQ